MMCCFWWDKIWFLLFHVFFQGFSFMSAIVQPPGTPGKKHIDMKYILEWHVLQNPMAIDIVAVAQLAAAARRVAWPVSFALATTN